MQRTWRKIKEAPEADEPRTAEINAAIDLARRAGWELRYLRARWNEGAWWGEFLARKLLKKERV